MLNEQEYKWIERLDALSRDNVVMDALSEWERMFLNNLLTRFRVHSWALRVSPKQWAVITKIGDKIIH